MIGTLLNAAAVVIGSIIGMFIKTKLPTKITDTTFQAIGLFTIMLGVTMAIKTNNFLIMVLSLVIGAIIGEYIDLEKRVDNFGLFLKNKINTKNDRFSEGFVTAFLLYCMGSMTILGAIEEGLGGVPNLLITKSLMDGFGSIVLASTMGVGVLFSSIPLLLYQGGLTLFASQMQSFFSDVIITELSAVGGILLLGLGISMLHIKKIKILNMLPSLIIVAILTYYFV